MRVHRGCLCSGIRPGATLWRCRRGTGVSDAFDRRNPEMKQLISSVTIGACLLLSSAGDVFAQNPHPPGTSGQLGTGSATPIAGCGSGTTANPITQPSPPGQAANTTGNSSPFPTAGGVANPTGAVSKYAGAGSGNYGAGTGTTPNTHANSQYDVACLQQVP